MIETTGGCGRRSRQSTPQRGDDRSRSVRSRPHPIATVVWPRALAKTEGGIARVRLPDGVVCEAEVHWYEATGIGRREVKVKRLLG